MSLKVACSVDQLIMLQCFIAVYWEFVDIKKSNL